MILHPAVVVAVGIDRLGVDVFHLELVERGSAHRVGDADVGAAVSVDRRALFVRSPVKGHVRGFHPDGENRGSARLQRDGGGRSIPLRRAAAVRIGVVQHQDVRIVLPVGGGVVGAGIFAVGHVVYRNVVIVRVRVVKIEVVEGGVIVVVFLFPGIVKFQLVFRGQSVPVCRGFRLGGMGKIGGGGEIFPRLDGSIDDAARRPRSGGGALRGGAVGARPARRRGDDEIFPVAVVEKFKAPVCDAGVIRFRIRLLGIVHARIAASPAGGQCAAAVSMIDERNRARIFLFLRFL